MTDIVKELAETLFGAESRKIYRLEGNSSVWHLEGISEQVEKIRHIILEKIVLSEAPVAVLHDDEPDEPELLKGLQKHADGIYSVIAPMVVSLLRKWLSPGNWQLYRPDIPLRIPDLCRANARTVADFVQDNALDFVIDSFHDDNFWVVGLCSTPTVNKRNASALLPVSIRSLVATDHADPNLW